MLYLSVRRSEYWSDLVLELPSQVRKLPDLIGLLRDQVRELQTRPGEPADQVRNLSEPGPVPKLLWELPEGLYWDNF